MEDLLHPHPQLLKTRNLIVCIRVLTPLWTVGSRSSPTSVILLCPFSCEINLLGLVRLGPVDKFS
jgi:hypothetical protein